MDSVTTVGGPEVELDEEPLFVVGSSEEGDHPLHLIRDARIRSDSGVVIVQQSIQSLLVFDREGVLRERVGGDGDGPGEFRRVRSVALLEADSVLAWDLGLRRLSAFDGSGELGEVISSRQGASPMDVHLVGTGTIAMVSAPQDNRGFFGGSGLSQEEHEVEFLNRSGEVIGQIDRIAGMEMYRGERGMAVPYGSHLRVAGGDAGLFVGDGRGARLVEFATNGEPTRVLQLPIERESLTGEQFSTRMQEYVDETYPPDLQGSALRTLEAAASAADIDSLPAFVDLRSDRNGHLWLEMSERDPDGSGRWLVVDPATNQARWVRGLPGWTVLDAGLGLVAAMREDSLGVEHLGVFPLPP